MHRRSFLQGAGGVLAATGLASAGRAVAASGEPLRISRILVQRAPGRRLTPVAPNAYAPYRGYDVAETVLRIQTSQGLEGIAHANPDPELLHKLLGRDPQQLFSWGNDEVVTGPAEAHRELVQALGGADVALLDLLGRATQRPVAALLGKPVRKQAPIYDSSLYMEDLLTPEQREGLAYLPGPAPTDPVELVVRKAEWILKERPEGFQALKLKMGRRKWMNSFEAAVERDVAVTNAVRKAVGPGIRLFVDGNKAYGERPLATADYAAAAAESKIDFLEEMFPEVDLEHTRELKQRLRAAGNPVRLAAGESYGGGIAEQVYTQRCELPAGEEPLIDVEQADMNATGFLRLRAKAAEQAKLGMTMAPHNFGSKLGFYAQIHLATVTPNWEICEVDDSEFPALVATGVAVKNGVATLTGAPGLGVELQEEKLEKPTLVLEA